MHHNVKANLINLHYIATLGKDGTIFAISDLEQA